MQTTITPAPVYCIHLSSVFLDLRVETRSSAIAVIADRTAYSILTLFIVIATSRPLNKKSACCQSADPTITADLRPHCHC